MLRIYSLIFSFLFIYASVSSQNTLSIENKRIYLNGQELAEEPEKSILDQLIKEKSKKYYIGSSYNPKTKEIDRTKRRSYSYKNKGLYVQYYAKEKGVYSISLLMRSGHDKPSKNNHLLFQNTFQDGHIILDTTATMAKTVALIGKEKLIYISASSSDSFGTLPYLLYSTNDLMIEITFDRITQLIQQVYISR